MKLGHRIHQLIRVNIKELAKRVRDPQQALDGFIEKLQAQLSEVKPLLFQAEKEERDWQRRCTEAQQLIDSLQKKAISAIEKGDDELAKEALWRKRSTQKDLAVAKAQHEQASRLVASIRSVVTELEAKIAEARREKLLYAAHAHSPQVESLLTESARLSSEGKELEQALEERDELREALQELEADLKGAPKSEPAEIDLEAELKRLREKRDT